MDQRAIAKARSRLRIAEKALADLAVCNNYEKFTDTWYVFLTAWKNVLTSLEQGSKDSAQSRQWYGAKKTERREDPLLQYLFQSRDDDEHGLEPITRRVPGQLALGVNKPGFSTKVRFNSLAIKSGRITSGSVESLDGKPVLVEQRLPYAALSTVRGRGGVLYQPPISHLGEPLDDPTPYAAGSLGLLWLKNLVEEAEGCARE